MVADLLSQLQTELAGRSARLTELLRAASVFHAPRDGETGEHSHAAALAEIDAFYDRWSFVLKDQPDFAAGLAEWRLDEKVFLLAGLGQGYQGDGRLSAAQAAFEEALALLGPRGGLQKAMLLVALAQAHSAAGAFTRADELLAQAIPEFSVLALTADPEMRATFVAQTVNLWCSRADLAMRAFDHGLAREHLDAAVEFSRKVGASPSSSSALELKLLQFELSTDTTGETLRGIFADRRRWAGLEADPSVMVDALLLLAETWLAHGESARALKILDDALKRVDQTPHKQWIVLRRVGDAQAAHGDATAALATFERALDMARSLGAVPEAVTTTLGQLVLLGMDAADPAVRLRAIQRIDELRTRGDDKLLVVVLARCAQLALQEGQADAYQSAVRALDDAEKHATSESERWLIAVWRVAAERYAERPAEALALTVRAIEELERFVTSTGGAVSDRPAWLENFATLHELAACLAVDLERRMEAMDWTERGRAVQLKEVIAPRDRPTAVPFGSERSWLTERGAGIAYLCVTRDRTLVLSLMPDSQDPLSEFVDIGEKEVEALLPPKMWSVEWTARVFAAADALESRLFPALERLCRRCNTLYIVPDSRLCFLPFAALGSKSGAPLIERCALAVAPSLAILERCHERALGVPPRSLLSVGVGKAESPSPRASDDFRNQARDVATLGWASKDLLLGDEATGVSIVSAMPDHDVVHIAVHGKIDGGGQLSSSRLSVAGGELSAREIAELDGRLRADVVFLNACLSGRFESALPGEVGGFWEAFLRAGASTLIAPLTYVDPEYASEIALGFHARRLSGTTSKAEALRQSQLSLRRRCPDRRAWAAHVLVGDAE